MNCPPDLVLKIPTKRGNRFVWGRWRWRWCELYMVIISDERRYRALNTRPRLPSDPPLWTQNPIMRRESWQPSWSYCASNAGSRQGAAQDNLTLSSPLLASPSNQEVPPVESQVRQSTAVEEGERGEGRGGKTRPVCHQELTMMLQWSNEK